MSAVTQQPPEPVLTRMRELHVLLGNTAAPVPPGDCADTARRPHMPDPAVPMDDIADSRLPAHRRAAPESVHAAAATAMEDFADDLTDEELLQLARSARMRRRTGSHDAPCPVFGGTGGPGA